MESLIPAIGSKQMKFCPGPAGKYTTAGNAKFASTRSQMNTYEMFKKKT